MQDPELLQILQGNAPARLELAVMEGALADVAPTQQERADAATAARIEELTASNPFGQAGYYNEQGDLVPPVAGNLTAALELEALNPELAARLKAEAQPAQPAQPEPAPAQPDNLSLLHRLLGRLRHSLHSILKTKETQERAQREPKPKAVPKPKAEPKRRAKAAPKAAPEPEPPPPPPLIRSDVMQELLKYQHASINRQRGHWASLVKL